MEAKIDLFKDVVELRYVGSGDDELGAGTFYLIFEWEGAMERALEALEAEGLSSELDFDVRLERNGHQATFVLRDEVSGKKYSTGLVRCSERDISAYRTEDVPSADTFAFGLVKVVPAKMEGIRVRHGSALRK